jgi:hypothetical protein
MFGKYRTGCKIIWNKEEQLCQKDWLWLLEISVWEKPH